MRSAWHCWRRAADLRKGSPRDVAPMIESALLGAGWIRDAAADEPDEGVTHAGTRWRSSDLLCCLTCISTHITRLWAARARGAERGHKVPDALGGVRDQSPTR